MISFFKRTIQDKFIKRILKPQIGVWINVVDPSSQELKYLVKEMGLDKRNLESGLDVNEVPRLDFVRNKIYVFTKIFSGKERKEIETYLIVIAEDFILTLSRSEPSFVRKILDGRVPFITTQKLKCLINLLSLIDKDFQEVTTEIVRDIHKQSRLTPEMDEKMLYSLLEKENFLNTLVSSYHHINLLYERIIRKIEFFEEDKEIIENLIEESTQGLNLCKSFLKLISNMREYYVILLSHRLNRTITILTVFTIFIELPTVISGIYGMNVLLPFQKNPWIFYYLIGIIGVIWLSFVILLRRKKII